MIHEQDEKPYLCDCERCGGRQEAVCVYNDVWTCEECLLEHLDGQLLEVASLHTDNPDKVDESISNAEIEVDNDYEVESITGTCNGHIWKWEN